MNSLGVEYTEYVDYTGQTDEELALQVQGNNPEAFGVLVERYEPRLFRYASRFVRPGEETSDLIQDTFLKAYENIQSFDSNRKFSPWIYRIAHNIFVNALRKSGREPVSFIDFDILTSHRDENNLEDDIDRREQDRLVDAKLAELPAIYREVLTLYYLEEMNYEEISSILHIPTGTVGVRLRRGREMLRKSITE